MTKHFCLSLPDGLHDRLQAVCAQRSKTITAYIREATAARLQSDLTGQRFCAEGSPCILALMPSYSNLAATSRSILDSSVVLDIRKKTSA